MKENEENNLDMEELANIFEYNFQQRLEEIAWKKLAKKKYARKQHPKCPLQLPKNRGKLTRSILHNHTSPPELKKPSYCWKKYTQNQDRETVQATQSFDNAFYHKMNTKLRLQMRFRSRQKKLLKMGKAAGIDGWSLISSGLPRALQGTQN